MSSKRKKAAGEQMFSAEAAFVSHNVPMSDPYSIMITNGDLVPHKIELFGFNRNHNKPRYGLPDMVKVTNLMSGDDDGYPELCAYLANTPNQIGKWRFQSIVEKNVKQVVAIKQSNPNGFRYTGALNLALCVDAYQFQSGLIDVTKVATFNGGTALKLEIAAVSSMVISVFPVAQVSLSRKLSGLDEVYSQAAPRLSGHCAAPIIVKTTVQKKSKKKTSARSAKKS